MSFTKRFLTWPAKDGEPAISGYVYDNEPQREEAYEHLFIEKRDGDWYLIIDRSEYCDDLAVLEPIISKWMGSEGYDEFPTDMIR